MDAGARLDGVLPLYVLSHAGAWLEASGETGKRKTSH